MTKVAYIIWSSMINFKKGEQQNDRMSLRDYGAEPYELTVQHCFANSKNRLLDWFDQCAN